MVKNNIGGGSIRGEMGNAQRTDFGKKILLVIQLCMYVGDRAVGKRKFVSLFGMVKVNGGERGVQKRINGLQCCPSNCVQNKNSCSAP